jgi:hydrogenase expression/formation protein HypC
MCLAIPGLVETIYIEEGVRMGRLQFGGVVKEICLEYLPEIEVGQYAIVHVGFAISRVCEQAALESLRTFAELGVLEEQLRELENS